MPKSGGVPGWENSLLVTALKRGSVYRIPLAPDGKTVSGPIERYFVTQNRYRDTAVSPDQKTIYVATDNGGLGEFLKDGVMNGTTTTMRNPGQILAFTYVGDGASTAAPATPVADGAPQTTDTPTVADTAGQRPVFTAAQADRGKVAYQANCVTCHGQNLIDTAYGTPLAGPYFADKWGGQPVGALYAYAHDKMPPSRPGSLPAESYADIITYVLQVNGATPGDAELPTDVEQLNRMTIPTSAN
jgi:mono/diheme cytochrome c family protein